jgi:hypothetical protein
MVSLFAYDFFNAFLTNVYITQPITQTMAKLTNGHIAKPVCGDMLYIILSS